MAGYYANFVTCTRDDQRKIIYSKESDLLQHIVRTREELKDLGNREVVSEHIFQAICDALDIVTENMVSQRDTACDSVTFLAEIFRVLRNSCAGCSRNQDIVNKNIKILELTRNVCEYIVHHKTTDDKDLVCIRCAAQFLGNAVTGSCKNQEFVWDLFSNLFKNMLLVEDNSLFNYTCMVLYNCMKYSDNTQQLIHSVTGQDIVKAILSQCRHYDSEWSLFVFEDLFITEDFLKGIYKHLNFLEMEILLDIMVSKMNAASKTTSKVSSGTVSICVSEGNMRHICNTFINEAHTVLRVSQKVDSELEPGVVMNHLECLSLATSQEQVYSDIKRDEKLLTAAINLLHCMKAIGESSENAFSQVTKMSSDQAGDVINPVFGMKTDLIRLICNMAYKNKEIQDKVRELGGISLILDHTNIDSRNPYITQWAVFAIRNLCDNNMDNQAVIAGLKLEGMVDNVEELRRYGVEAEVQGEKVIIKKVSQQPPDQV